MNPRFFCPQALPRTGEIELPQAAAHHADRVLRMRPGDTLTLFDGQGEQVRARLLSVGRGARAELLEWSGPRTESPLELVLVQSLASGDKMDWVVRKAVELGVSRIIPLAAERSVLKLSGQRAEKRLRHWRQIVISACEQCGRNRLPDVALLTALPGYLAGTEGCRRLVLAPRGGQRLSELQRGAGPVHLLVGPEGGWSDHESAQMQAVGCESVSIGPRVLRTETAGLAAAAAMQTMWGDF